MTVKDQFNQCKTDAGPTEAASRGSVKLVERFEKFTNAILGDPYSRIMNVEKNQLVKRHDCQRNLTFLWSEFDRIIEQLDQYPADAVAVSVDLWK